MNEIEVLWHESGHITANIPESLIIKDKEIKDWLYTSGKGYVMKHKRVSISISKILELFSSDTPEKIAILHSSNQKSILSLDQFEAFLLSINDMTCEGSFVLQKYIPFEYEVQVIINFITESISLNEDPLPDFSEEIVGQSRRVMFFLISTSKNLVTGTFYWSLYEKSWFLTNLNLIRSKEPNIRCITAHSQAPLLHNLSRRKSRPLTALTEGKILEKDTGSFYSVRQRSRPSKIQFSLTSLNNTKILSNSECQTDEQEQCLCENDLKEGSEELKVILQENEDLERMILECIEEGKLQRVKAEDRWKAKCLEISKAISDKIFEEKNKYVDEIKTLKKVYDN
ncbi:hypothetical protein SteCoe_21707 [Stentor coeruleus]|uniref:Uncharacterized protein n=1 Tax=Stentor coeruleus TaxID=5963 RepID=A0A1R2BNX8_9CILI|nr:hypothetical protein SteCoe_21707 [Stentor coeruleus]